MPRTDTADVHRSRAPQVPEAAGHLPRLQERERVTAVTPTSSSWARRFQPRSVDHRGPGSARGRIHVEQALLRFELGRPGEAERLGRTLLGSPRSRTWTRGKPVFNTSRNGGKIASATASSSTGATTATALTFRPRPPMSPQLRAAPTSTAPAAIRCTAGPAPIGKGPPSFGQWFVDGTFTNNTHQVTTLELAPLAGTQYQFTSQPHRGLRPASSRWTPRASSR